MSSKKDQDICNAKSSTAVSLTTAPPTSNKKYRVYVYDSTLDKPICYSTPLGIPDDIRPEPTMTKEDITKMIKSIGVEACQSNVASEYVNDAADNNPILLVAAIPKLNDLPEPVGFVMCAPHKHMRDNTKRTVMYLDVICAKPLSRIGGKLVDHFIDFSNMKTSANGSPAFQAIKLSSLASVLSFYPSKGFEFRKHCGDDAKVIPIPDSFRNMIERYKNEGKTLPTRCDQAHKIPEYKKLMILLHKEGFTVKTTDGCNNRAINWEDFKSGACDNDGFVMIRCRKASNVSKKLNYGTASKERNMMSNPANETGYSAEEEEEALKKYEEALKKYEEDKKGRKRRTSSRITAQTRKRNESVEKIQTQRRTRTKRTTS